MVTVLERAIWEAAEPIRGTRFGRILRNARVSERDPSLPGPDDETQLWELSFDPAIQRTLAAVTGIEIERQSPPDTDSEWLKWNLEAKKAVTRLAAKCWAGIHPDRRVVFIDEDNFQPIWGQMYLHELRSDTTGRHLNFEGLSDPDVRAALRAVYQAARGTPSYENVRRADRQLAQSRDKLLLWAQLALKGHKELETALQDLTIADGRQRGLEIVRTTYAGTPVEEIAIAFQRYNRLVQHIVWSILGLAEIAPRPFVVTDTVGTLWSTRSTDGSPSLRVTSTATAVFSLRLTYPVWLATGTPLDGLYLVVAYTMRLFPGAAEDLRLTPITWSAGCWPYPDAAS